MIFKVLVLLVYLAPTLLGNPQNSRCSDAYIEDYPYTAQVFFSEYHYCAGVIISPKWVLTSSQCTAIFSVEDFSVRAATSQYIGGVQVNVKNIYQNKKYVYPDVDYAISIIELEEELNDENAVPISLPETVYDPVNNARANLTSWDVLREAHNNWLQIVNTRILGHTACVQTYAGLVNITERMVCARPLDEGTRPDGCMGDNGAPLVIDNQLVGIVARGHDCIEEGYPGIYTSLGSEEIRNFVREITGL